MHNQDFIQDLASCTDEQLLAKCAACPDAEEALISRYTRLVRSCARPLFLTGGDHEDLVQEGMIGLLHAVRSYDPASGTPFEAYAAICIRHKLFSAIRAAAAEKHAPLNDSVSIQSFSFDDTVHWSIKADPETVFIGREGFHEFMNALRQRLSRFENQVLSLYLEGLSYREIAVLVRKSEKAADNAVQRIRKKANLIIGENGPSV